jgi:hypothetical protein
MAHFQNGPSGRAGLGPSSRIASAAAATRQGVEWACLARATAAATGLLSIPTEGSRSARAAKSVVPRPQNGSSTHWPG